jgi:hypothetical protein
MPDCQWITDENGAEILLIDDKEVARISDARNMRNNKVSLALPSSRWIG